MSDRELGKKMAEEMELEPFLDAYKEAVENYLSYAFGRHERPDFICYRADGTPVGVELVQITRNPIIAREIYILTQTELMPSEEAMEMLYNKIREKEEKRRQPDWYLPDNTVLVLQFFDCPIRSLPLSDDSLQKDFASTGFVEIWIADYTGEEAYGDIELFCLYPPERWGYYERPNPGRKPYR